MRRPRKGTGIGSAKTDDPRAGHNLHGCPSCHQKDGLRGAWARPKVRAPGKEAHRSATESLTGYNRFEPVVPGTQGSRRQ